MIVIRVLASSNPRSTFFDKPTWIKSADVEAFDGRGDATLTTDLHEALQFPDAGAALDFWKAQSQIRPLRDDGLPNRPLTAFTVEIGAAEE